MSIKKATLASLILLSLTACSSGSGSNGADTSAKSDTKQQTSQQTQAEKEAAEKAAAEKAAAEKAEAERLAAEKAAAEKAEAERLAAEKAAAEKAEAERLAAEKAAAEKAEAERLAAEKAAAEKAEAERLAAEKQQVERLKALAAKAGIFGSEADSFAEQNLNGDPNNYLSWLGGIKYQNVQEAALKAGLSVEQAQELGSKYSGVEADIADSVAEIAKLKAEKEAAEKAEAERLAAEKAAAEKAEAERLAAEKARQEKLASYKSIAMDLGLSEEEAEAVANRNLDKTETAFKQAIESYKLEKIKGISDSAYPISAITDNSRVSSVSTTNAFTQASRIHTVVYNQPYSAVIADYSGNVSYNNQTGKIFTDNRTSSIQVKGLKTEESAIPNEGSATYSGKAFNGTIKSEYDWNTHSSTDKVIEGQTTYNVNFATRTGSGKITGLGDDVILAEGQISGTGISSAATQSYRSGSYALDFYGKNAEEIGGKVVLEGKDTIGFGGTRGEIQK